MKKTFIRSLSILVMLVMILSVFCVFGSINVSVDQSRAANFNHNYNLNGEGPHDMLEIAKAQDGKKGYELDYSEDWCANFVADCAELAGQSSAIPKESGYAGVDDLEQIIYKHNGQYIRKRENVKPGDIVFYDREPINNSPNHVEIVVSVSGKTIYSVGGNTGNYDDCRYTYVNSLSTT